MAKMTHTEALVILERFPVVETMEVGNVRLETRRLGNDRSKKAHVLAWALQDALSNKINSPSTKINSPSTCGATITTIAGIFF